MENNNQLAGGQSAGVDLIEAAKELIDSMFWLYTAGNGRKMSIQDTAGEKCWIVPADNIERLKAAIHNANAESLQPATTGEGDEMESVAPGDILKFEDGSDDIVRVDSLFKDNAIWFVNWTKISGKGTFANGNSILQDFLFIEKGESDNFELQRLYDWLMDENRESANTKFTSGLLRKVADEIAFRLHLTPSPNATERQEGEKS